MENIPANSNDNLPSASAPEVSASAPPVAVRRRLRIPIAGKLVFLSVLLLLAATVPIALKNADDFEQTSSLREKDVNRDQVRARATEVEAVFLNYVEKVRVTGTLLLQRESQRSGATQSQDLGANAGSGSVSTQSPFDLTFNGDRDLASLEIWELKRGIDKTGFERTALEVNSEFLKQYGADVETVKVMRERRPYSHEVYSGQIDIFNSSLPSSGETKGLPMLTLAMPLVKDPMTGQITHVAVAGLRLDRLQKVFARVADRLMYLVDEDGTFMAHPDDKKVIEAASGRGQEIVDAALGNSSRNKTESHIQMAQKRDEFVGADGLQYAGDYARTSLGPTVVVQVPMEIILEPARKLRRTTFFITGLVLSVALFFVFVFSITLTAPIERLVEMSNEVARGNLGVKANVRSRDEVGELADAFDHMVEGLQERDKVKNVLDKFHGSSVADDLMKGDLSLRGSRKDVTVFFSDIRDFTKFSEGRSPEEVVDMLNEYFHVMVDIIYRYGGIVDKFIGDAIMAVWGAPSSTGQDERNATLACLEMRKALVALNDKRIERGETEIRIGMALHSGHAISGTIGSSQRMEYTVIGDTVNMTSRIEASTKAFGTDFLVSESTAKTLQDRFLVEAAGTVEVKGKSQPLTLYRVRGYFDESGNAVEIRTKYSEYAAASDDKIKVA